MPPEELLFPARLSRVRETLLTSDREALLFLDLNNIRYLTGFTGSDGAFILDSRQALLLVDGRYTTQAGEEARGTRAFEYRDKVEGIAEKLTGEAIRTVGFEASALSVETYEKLKEKIPAISMQPLTSDLVNIRAIKDEMEIARLRMAAAIASRTLIEMQDIIRPGLREWDVALELEYRMRKNGAAGVSFPIIVAAALDSALPHATPGSRKILAGDVLVIDYGAVFEGYHSDETCTFIMGKAPSGFIEAYEVVKTAHDLALEAVKAGISCSEIDRVARSCIEAAGLGRYFAHGTGHGVGLDVHEPPRIAASSKLILEAGMVVTVEPGVYFPGKWGIRIEDMALVREQDCEILTKVPKDLSVLY